MIIITFLVTVINVGNKKLKVLINSKNRLLMFSDSVDWLGQDTFHQHNKLCMKFQRIKLL